MSDNLCELAGSTCSGVNLEAICMLKDVEQEAMCYGHPLTVYLNVENRVTRDRYNQIVKLPNLDKNVTAYAYPLTPTPNQYQLNKAGIKEEVDLLAYTPRITWFNEEVDFDDIKQESTEVNIGGKTYIIKDKNEVSQIASVYLYWTLGLVVK